MRLVDQATIKAALRLGVTARHIGFLRRRFDGLILMRCRRRLLIRRLAIWLMRRLTLLVRRLTLLVRRLTLLVRRLPMRLLIIRLTVLVRRIIWVRLSLLVRRIMHRWLALLIRTFTPVHRRAMLRWARLLNLRTVIVRQLIADLTRGVLELTQTLAEPTRNLRDTLRPEENQDEEEDDQELGQAGHTHGAKRSVLIGAGVFLRIGRCYRNVTLMERFRSPTRVWSAPRVSLLSSPV